MSKRTPHAEREWLIKRVFPKRDYFKVPKPYRAMARQFDRQVLKLAIDMAHTSGLLSITSFEPDLAMIDKVISSAALVATAAGFAIPGIIVSVESAE